MEHGEHQKIGFRFQSLFNFFPDAFMRGIEAHQQCRVWDCGPHFRDVLHGMGADDGIEMALSFLFAQDFQIDKDAVYSGTHRGFREIRLVGDQHQFKHGFVIPVGE